MITETVSTILTTVWWVDDNRTRHQIIDISSKHDLFIRHHESQDKILLFFNNTLYIYEKTHFSKREYPYPLHKVSPSFKFHTCGDTTLHTDHATFIEKVSESPEEWLIKTFDLKKFCWEEPRQLFWLDTNRYPLLWEIPQKNIFFHKGPIVVCCQRQQTWFNGKLVDNFTPKTHNFIYNDHMYILGIYIFKTQREDGGNVTTSQVAIAKVSGGGNNVKIIRIIQPKQQLELNSCNSYTVNKGMLILHLNYNSSFVLVSLDDEMCIGQLRIPYGWCTKITWWDKTTLALCQRGRFITFIPLCMMKDFEKESMRAVDWCFSKYLGYDITDHIDLKEYILYSNKEQ